MGRTSVPFLPQASASPMPIFCKTSSKDYKHQLPAKLDRHWMGRTSVPLLPQASVSTMPGMMALTVALCGAKRIALVRTRYSMAALACPAYSDSTRGICSARGWSAHPLSK